MVSGFKDKNKKFHPITRYKGVSRSSHIRYANGAGSSQVLEQSVKDFAIKQRDRYNQYRANQQENFNREIEMRRRFQGRLITAFRQARAQNVKQGRDLEKFIRQQIPDLPQEKGIEKFVRAVLRDFLKQEKGLEKSKKGKSEDEKKGLQSAFDDSLRESELTFRNIQTEQDKKFRQEAEKTAKENKKKFEKLEKETREKEQAERKALKDAQEAEKKRQQDTSKAEQEQADKKAEESAKQADKEQRDETSFETEVMEELNKDKQEAKDQDFSFGFPTEIV